MAQSIIELASVVMLGLAFGSFATALAWRVPRGISWIVASKGEGAARSACAHCGKVLSWRDLVPVLSWLLLRGKCRYCGQPVSPLYPLTEILTLAGCIGVYAVWGFTVPGLIVMAVIPFLAALLAVDAEHMILPDQLVAISAVLAIFLVIYQCVAYEPLYGFGRQALLKLCGMLVYGGLAWVLGYVVGLVKKTEALGMGDVKFFAMAGLWMGLTYLPFFLMAAGLSGIFIGFYYRLYLKKQLFPFGPALILALYAGLLLQGLEIVPVIGVQ